MTRPQRFRLWIPGAILAALIGIALPAAAETIFVSSNGVGVTSSPLIAGQMYLFTVSGTYTYTSGGNGADAEFSDAGEFYPGFGRTNDTLDLLLDGTAVDWLGSADGGTTWTVDTFSADHVYRLHYTGNGAGVTFSIADQSPFGPAFYSDNAGTLTLSIAAETAVPQPATLTMLVSAACGLAAVVARRRQTA